MEKYPGYDLVLKFFDGDKARTEMWHHTRNLHIGWFKPLEFISNGREEKLLEFIKSAIEVNLK